MSTFQKNAHREFQDDKEIFYWLSMEKIAMEKISPLQFAINALAINDDDDIEAFTNEFYVGYETAIRGMDNLR